ncbi:MAG: LuxR family transcriptional regulator, partial [Eggerthellaceae bacterium]
MGSREKKSTAPRRITGLPLRTGLILIAGFGLFRGVNSSSYLSAIGSVDAAFLFVPDIAFNVLVAFVIIALSLIVVLAVRAGALPVFSMPYRIPIAFLCCDYLLGAAGVLSALPPAITLAISAFSFGLCSVSLSLVWIEFFVMERPTMIIGQIAAGMLLSVLCSAFLGLLPLVAQALVSCGIFVFVGGAIFYLRGNLAPILAQESLSWTATPFTFGSFWATLGELSDSLIAFFALEAVIGVVNSYMLAGERIFIGAESVSRIAMAVAVVLFWILVVMTQRMPKVSTVFRLAAPPIAAMLVLVPFLSDAYSVLFTVALLASYDFIAVLITYQVAAVCHVRRVVSYAVMAVALGGARLCLLAALLAGTAVGSVQGGYFGDGEQSLRFLVVVVAVIYTLTIVLVFFSRDRKRRRAREQKSVYGEGALPEVEGTPQVPVTEGAFSGEEEAGVSIAPSRDRAIEET